MLSKNETFTMKEQPLDEEYDADSEYDSEYASKIFAAREAVFGILEREGLSIHEKLIVILSLGSEVTERSAVLSMA